MLYRHGPLPKLGLDLDPASLTQTGTGNTEIHARDAAGAAIAIVYAAGILTVRRTPPDGEGETLLQERVGPPSHHDLLLGQIHDLVGITVGGARPRRSVERRADSPLHHIRALGADTVYWEQTLMLTAATAARYLSAIAAAMPRTVVLEPRWRRPPEKPWQLGLQKMQDLAGARSPLIIVPAANDGQIAQALDEAALTPERIDALLPNAVQLQYHWDPMALRRDADERSQRASRVVGRTISLHECPSATVTTRVWAADPARKAQALGLARITDQMFGKEIEIVDLASGQVLKTMPTARWYGADIAQWSREAPDRYLAVQIDTAENRALGYRPRRTEDA